MEGEDDDEVDARYFSLRDKLAKKMQKTLGTDEPLTEKQVREAYGEGRTQQATLKEKLSGEQRTSAILAGERDAAKADVASSNLRLEQKRKETSILEKRVALLEAQIAAMTAQNEAAKRALENSGFGGRATAIKSALSALEK
ncbi:MAG: hypothetical protein ACD_48C00140G0001 [uncultured bacterium]|nr:MAG: hypothetical protein ACD_48C00140G0001 [uncultured bacterium]